MRINVLTYDTIHRKTHDTLSLLLANGYTDIAIFAKPFSYAKKFKPLLQHRPSMENLSVSEGYNFGIKAKTISEYEDIDALPGSVFLVCGAGLLPNDFIAKHRVINAHPGYIPYVRGLDAYKWAIYEDLPIGVTTHIIGNEIDAGEIIERVKIPIFSNDTFHSVAYRVYETEISMLVRAIKLLDEPHEYISGDKYPIHKRMPNEIEKTLLERFVAIQEKRINKSDKISSITGGCI